MSWTPIVGRAMDIPALQAFIDNMRFDKWRPTGMVVHNTGAPTLGQWHQVPGLTRMRNLENYYKNQRGWSSAPHAFVADDYIWPFTPFNMKGTHSPSWNGTKIGIEMVGDFEREDPYSGRGLGVYKNTVALFGMLHEKLGLNPDTINIHREDPRTKHACPGKNFIKKQFILDVKDWMNHAGDDRHNAPEEPKPVATEPKYYIRTNTPGDSLNVRSKPSVSGNVISKLDHGSRVGVFSSEMNRTTKWLRIHDGAQQGWIAAAFTKEDKDA